MPEPQVLTRNIQTYTLVAAIANSVVFVIGTVLVIGAGISTFGCGCLLIVLPLVNLASAIVDFVAYGRLSQPPTPQIYSAVKTSAVLDLLACFALVPLIMGILKLQLLADEGVRAYFNVTAISPTTTG